MDEGDISSSVVPKPKNLDLRPQLYKDPSLVPSLAQQQEAWLERTLRLPSSEKESPSICTSFSTVTPRAALPDPTSSSSSSSSSLTTSSPRHSVAFMHIPPFLVSPDEPDDVYFNLPSERRAKFLRKLYDGGIRLVVVPS